MDPNTRIVQVKMPNANGTIIMEAAIVGEQKVALPKEFSFANISATVESIATELQHTFETVKPKKSSVKFGLELGVESGQLTAFLVKGSGKANLEITLEWGG